MNYQLTASLLASASREDHRKLISEYIQAQANVRSLHLCLEEAHKEIKILKAENALMKKEINDHV